jgi:RNA polymerase sigma-70 factor (ECF subfamily)
VTRTSTPGAIALRDQSEPRTGPTDAGRTSEAVDVALAASGDARAFERLYRAQVGRIHGLCRRMLSPEEADEATQDVFVRAWEKLGTFRGESAFGTWLHRLAVNVILAKRASHGTRRKRESDDETVWERLGSRPATPELSMDVEQALARLPEGAREIFVLHDVEGYRHEEIAEMLGLATGTSKSQLHRARMALRQYLDR